MSIEVELYEPRPPTVTCPFSCTCIFREEEKGVESFLKTGSMDVGKTENCANGFGVDFLRMAIFWVDGRRRPLMGDESAKGLTSGVRNYRKYVRNKFDVEFENSSFCLFRQKVNRYVCLSTNWFNF